MVLRKYALCAAVSASLAACAGVQPPAQAGAGPSAKNAAAHVAEAMLLAGTDLRAEAERLCPNASAPPSSGSYHNNVHAPLSPARVFDDMDYVGHEGVGVTILKTSAGLILIDSMTTDDEVERVLLPGLAALGHDPAEIVFILVTHGHGDHHGGVNALRRINPSIKVVMSDADWAFASQPFYMRDGSLDPAPRPDRLAQDIGYSGTARITLGATKIDLVETPGHTIGTTSLLYPVHQAGQRHMVMQWGGGNPTQGAFADATVASFITRAREAGVTVLWSSHAQDYDLPRLAAIRAGVVPHPFILGAERFERWAGIVLACRAAKAAQPN